MTTAEIPESLYAPYLHESRTDVATFRVHAGTPQEYSYQGITIDVPTLLDAIAAEGLPVACPTCGGVASLVIPTNAPASWEVLRGHKDGCHVPDRQTLRLVE